MVADQPCTAAYTCLVSFVHASADVADDAVIGEGAKVWHYAQVREGARLGSNVHRRSRRLHRHRCAGRRQLQDPELRAGLRAGASSRTASSSDRPSCSPTTTSRGPSTRTARPKSADDWHPVGVDHARGRLDRRERDLHRPGRDRALGARRRRLGGRQGCARLRTRRRQPRQAGRLGRRRRRAAATTRATAPGPARRPGASTARPATDELSEMESSMIPAAKPHDRRRGARRRRPGDRSPGCWRRARRSRRSRQEFSAARRRTSQRRAQLRHLRAAPAVPGRRGAARRRDHRPLVQLRRDRQRGRAGRRDPGVRRHRARHLQPRPGRGRGRDHAAHQGRSCPCTCTATRPTWWRIDDLADRHGIAAVRGCGAGHGGERRRHAGRRLGHRIVLVLPDEEHDLRRGRDGDDRLRRGGAQHPGCCATRAWSAATRTRSSASTTA